MKHIVAVVFEGETTIHKVSDADVLRYARALLESQAIEAIAGVHVDWKTRAMLADTIRGSRDLARETKSAGQRDKAKRPRKASTKAVKPGAVRAFKAQHVAEHGSPSGWRKAASKKWPGVSPSTLSNLARSSGK